MMPVVTFGPSLEPITLDDEFHDSVRRCVSLREHLKQAAETTAKQRGHKLALWTGNLDHWATYCVTCGAGVTVETKWPEVTGKATGAALTSNCVPAQ